MTNLGKRITELAAARGWTRAKLAERARIDKSHFSRLLLGKRNWQPEQLERVAEQFEVAVADLVKDTEAEGLPDAEQSTHDANRLMIEQLAEIAVAKDELAARLTATQEELEAVRKERDEARAELRQAQQALRAAPSKKVCDDLRRQRDALEKERSHQLVQIDDLQRRITEVRREGSQLRGQLTSAQTSLKQCQQQVATNYQACMYWKGQAEDNGKKLAGVTLFAAGIGLAKLLSNDHDSDDFEDDDDSDDLED